MIEIKVFISCPSEDTILGDLASDLESIADGLNRYYEHQGFRIKPLHWKQPYFVGSEKGKGPQELIFDKIGEYDLYFGMMGSKYGRELPGCSESPTEFEFNDALEKNAASNQHGYPRVVCFSFLDAKEEDCVEGQFEKIKAFRERAWLTGISHVYQSKDEIVDLFENKIKECIDTTYIRYPCPNEYRVALAVTERTSAKDDVTPLSNQTNIYGKIRDGKRILLLGRGGSGKSTYLRYLAYQYSCKVDLFTPVYIKLKLYSGESIEELVKKETRSMPKRPLLLLDGYDEIDTLNEIAFRKRLIKYKDDKLSVPIVVASRPIDSSMTLFKDFQLYEVSALEYNQVKQYLELCHIDESLFSSYPTRSELYSLLQIPFYLVKIVEFYQTEGKLPTDMSQIMESAIVGDREHFLTTVVDDYEYDEMGGELSALSFCMTKSGRISLSRRELASIVPDDKMVDFFRKYTRLIESETINQEKVYSFSHKIFQDYLAAKAICQFSLPDIMEIISNSNEGEIYHYWVPAIPFIIELLQRDDREALVEHIFSKQPSLLIDVNSDLLCDEMKKKLFTSTFEYYASSTQYIPRSVDKRKLASIWDSASMEQYLLAFIRDTNNKGYMLIEAFILLSYSEKTNKEAIDKALIECMQNQQLADYRGSLNSMATLFIKIDDFDQASLDGLYEQNPRDTVQLLAVYDKSFMYISELIDLYGELEEEVNQRDSEIKQSIEDYLVYCVQSGHLKEVVKELIESKILRDTHCLLYKMQDIVQSAFEHYEFDDAYEDMYRLFVHCIDIGSGKHFEALGGYFIRRNVEYQVVKRLFDEGKNGSFGVSLLLLNRESVAFVRSICEELIPGLSHAKRERIIKQLACTEFPPLYKEVLEQGGISLEQYKAGCIKEIQKKRLLKDMELILSVDLLLSELDDIYEDKDSITFEQYRSIARHKICTIIDKLMRGYCRNNPKENAIPKQFVAEKLEKNHPEIALWFITRYFVKGRNDNAFSDDMDVGISPELKNWLSNWKEEVLRGVDITKSCRQIDIYSVECDKRVALLWGYAKNGLIEIDDAVLLDFLSFVRVTGEDWSIIEDKIGDKQQMRSRVAQNLKNKHLLTFDALANHIWFCNKNCYREALSHCYDILRRLDDDYGGNVHLRDCCIQTIIRIEDNRDRFNNYVIDCPIDILDEFAKGYIQGGRSMDGLKERLKTEVKSGKHEFTRFYPFYLVCMGDVELLPQYIDDIKQTKEFYVEFEYPNPFELIADETKLDLMLDLLSFSFQNEIRQSPYNNLIRCILSCVENIAYQSRESYEIAFSTISGLAKQHPGHEDTSLLFEFLWRIREEMPKRTIMPPSLTESLELYDGLMGTKG